MKTLRRLAVGVVALIALLAIVGVLLPASAHVERSIDIAAPACTVFAQVNSFQRSNAWSPWAKLDPNTQNTYEGPEEGVGAAMHWTSHAKNVGSGSQKITTSTPCTEVHTDLDFGDNGLATTALTIAPAVDAVHVTWTLDSPFGWNLAARYAGLMFDRMIGPDYEEGLANLKTLAEALPKADFADLVVERKDVAGTTIAYVSREIGPDPVVFAQTLGGAYFVVSVWIAANHLAQAGPPVAIFHRWDETGTAFDAGIPVVVSAAAPPPADSSVKLGQAPSGRAVVVTHTGPYTGLAAAHDQLTAWLAAHGLQTSGSLWEEYVSDPGTTPDDQLVTKIYVLVK